MAICAAQLGRRVALVQLSESPATTTLATGLANDEIEKSIKSDQITVLTLKPEDVLVEYLQDHGLSALGRRLISSGVVSVIATAVPGIKELLILGKIKQLERLQTYDTIILDSPASGHLITFLSSPKGLGDIANVGLLRSQAEEVTALLKDPSRCKVVLVTLPEETPVEETLQTISKIRELDTVEIGPVIINGVIHTSKINNLTRDKIGEYASQIPEFGAYSYVEARQAMQIRNIDLLRHKLGNLSYFQLPLIFSEEMSYKSQLFLAQLMTASDQEIQPI